MSGRWLSWCGVFLVLASSSAAHAAGDKDAPLPAAEAVRVEACRANDDPVGRPLPLASHWNTGSFPPADTFDPAYQLGLIGKGRHILLFLSMPGPTDSADRKGFRDYCEKAVKKAAELKLPLCFIASQWESLLTYNKAYLDLPADKNPNVVGLDGKIRKEVDAMGPVGPWREVGKSWTTSPGMKLLQKWYPDPPLVEFLSNNEHSKLWWPKAEESKRYLDSHGKGKSDDFKRKVVADGWLVRFRALQTSMREGLASANWKKNAIFVGYDAFGPPHFARMKDWKEYSLYVPGRIDPSPLMWDGGSPSFYVHNWNGSADYKVWSPQVEAMNWVFMLRETCKLNPKFFFELSTWDGNVDQPNDKRKLYAKLGQTYNAERYGGMVRFGMWLTHPRVVREFRGWTEKRSIQGSYFDAVVGAVDEVHDDAVLRRFWRKGRLVANRAHAHPYQTDLPSEYKNEDRWFLLDTNLDPKRPWTRATELPVFSLSLVLGEGDGREFLVYAHAPLGLRKDVEVIVPDLGPIKIDVPTGGAFYRIAAKTKKVKRVGGEKR